MFETRFPMQRLTTLNNNLRTADWQTIPLFSVFFDPCCKRGLQFDISTPYSFREMGIESVIQQQ